MSGFERYEGGRHGTFAVRHGWLGKGMARIEETGGFSGGGDTADALGLGSVMAKSLRYWLEACGLADASPAGVSLSALGRAARRLDPHLEMPATWWLAHLSLAGRPRSVWGWYFGEWPEQRFLRADAAAAYARRTAEASGGKAAPATAHRDVACLLLSYAAPPDSEKSDPEDPSACPLRELGLLARLPSGAFERTRPDTVPMEAFLACAGRAASAAGIESASASELARMRSGPGRMMGLDADTVDSLAGAAAAAHAALGVSYARLGGERRLRVPPMGDGEWLEANFVRTGIAA